MPQPSTHQAMLPPPAQAKISTPRIIAYLTAALSAGGGMWGGAAAWGLPARCANWLAHCSPAMLTIGMCLVFAGLIALALCGGLYLVRINRELQGWRAAYQHMQLHSLVDPATGLSNLPGLESKATLVLARMRRGHGPVSMLVVRLGGGVTLAPNMLRAVGERLTGTVRTTDAVARISSNEFAILAELRSPEDAAILAERVIQEMRVPATEPASMPDTSKLQLRIGIAIAPDDADSTTMLLQRARQALEPALHEGDNSFSFFSRDMQTRSRQREELRHLVIEAVAHAQISLNYQPIVELDTRRIAGFEALARWAPPGRRQIPPAFFIPAAEDSGVISMLTDQLLTQACAAASTWPSDQIVALNLSPRQIRDKMIVHHVRHALENNFLPGSRLELELTDEALREDLPQVTATLAQLKALGVRLVLDDSGLSQAGLAALSAITFDKIKICAQRTGRPAAGSEAAQRLAAMLDAARNHGIAVVADGVETEADAARMSGMGCALAQGWWFGHPIPADYVKAIFTPQHF